MVKLVSGVPVIVNTAEKAHFQLDPADLRATLTKHPKVACIILCNPSNPTGAVSSEANQHAIAAVLKDFPKVRGARSSDINLSRLSGIPPKLTSLCCCLPYRCICVHPTSSLGYSYFG
jgi:hypothetical protein